MLLAVLALISGLALLVWSADRFVDGAAATARFGGMPPLLIGMLVVGFGTSAPEMVVSAMAAADGNPALALGNAYGSNITNIALIIGLVALISPINVHSQVLKKELPLLLAITLFAGWQMFDHQLSRLDAWCLLAVFAFVMAWSVWQGMRNPQDAMAADVNTEINNNTMTLKQALIWLVLGLVLLIIASRFLVYGAVYIAQGLGVSDLVIGLTVVAVGTSLPELASSLMAIKKGEHDIALGNIIGSNLFNTLAVVGIAALIEPMAVDPVVLTRDYTLMFGLTVALLVLGIGIKKAGRINRLEGALLLAVFFGYTGYLITTAF
ncbi:MULTISPECIES: calcium/sodium antiporter [unclassified Arsukibacterium]|uniref:calcium/sodium antiporter n=1 Tax=unclassified Arsukibacterium TaxID=2635278 RepID=UPI000C67B947|nr:MULTISPECIES: calcium/sodium antiporter [unclassified Arsukibacterium]MBM35116.1 calcium/sodium antiporter [Rheinheimera sp.]|tara:strand:- start:29210 stop:30175 length:966 start_codon:yes stop_codon:yes gene_type:complete